MSQHRTRQRGIVLIVVLFFVLLTVSGVATFLRRASIDGMIARNRDHGARADALARGGVQLATAILLQDRLDEGGDLRVETREDLWARIGALTATLPDGEELTIRIEDAGAQIPDAQTSSFTCVLDARRFDLEPAIVAQLKNCGCDEQRLHVHNVAVQLNQ